MEHMTMSSGRSALELGSRLGRRGVLAVGAGGGNLAWMLARCAGCGASLSGADVLFHDGGNPACGVWLARRYRIPTALYFLETEGRPEVWLCDGAGRALSPESLPPYEDWAGASGTWDRLCGTDDAYAAYTVGGRNLDSLLVAVRDEPDQASLSAALERLGCEVLRRPKPGVPLLRQDRSGFSLTVREDLRELRPQGRDAISAAVDWCLARAAQAHAIPAFGSGEGEKI